MRAGVTARRPVAGMSYPTLESFYRADSRRVSSREQDVGLWWRDAPDGPLHRAAWIGDTGELYLARLGPDADPKETGERVEVLVREQDIERLEQALEGWRERCGEPGSLRWLRDRASRLAVPQRVRRQSVAARLGATSPARLPVTRALALS